jgi:hypothetical protein
MVSPEWRVGVVSSSGATQRCVVVQREAMKRLAITN